MSAVASGRIPAASSPTDQACHRARTYQGQALRVAAKARPALTGPARGGCEIWRSGRKNARGAGRTKEWTERSEGRMFAEQVELPRVAFVACGRGGLVVTALHFPARRRRASWPMVLSLQVPPEFSSVSSRGCEWSVKRHRHESHSKPPLTLFSTASLGRQSMDAPPLWRADI